MVAEVVKLKENSEDKIKALEMAISQQRSNSHHFNSNSNHNCF